MAYPADAPYASAPQRPLPRARVYLFFSLAICALISEIMGAIILNFSIEESGTYLRSNPEIIVASGFTLLSLLFSLVIARRTFFTQVWCELIWLGVAWFMFMGGTTTLNEQTPALISSPCGQWFYCRGLMVMFVFSCFSLLILTLLFFPILIMSALQHARRTGFASGVWKSKVEDWEGWSGGWTWEGRAHRRRTMTGTGAGGKNLVGNPGMDNSPYVIEEPKLGEEDAGFGEVPHLAINGERFSTSTLGNTRPSSFAPTPKGLGGDEDDNPFAKDVARVV